MQSLGLSAADLAAYHRALATHGSMSVEVRVMTLSGVLVSSLKPQANTGQVNLDAGSDVTRSGTLAFLDESRSLQFESDSPSDGAVYFDNMVQIIHRVRVRELGRRISCPVITGPLVKFDRTGDEVTLEVQGKESLALQGVPVKTIPKNKNAIDAIRDILADCCGETQFAFPTTTRTLPKPVVVGREDETKPWTVCKSIAKSIGLHLYYDGAGVCRLRDIPGNAVFTFRAGEGGNITSAVQVSHDKSQIRNRVVVVGSKPSHVGDARLDDSHPFSSLALARNGVRQYLYEDVQDSLIGSQSAAQRRAEALLKPYELMEFGSTFNSVPVPHLDELDMFHVESDEYVGTEQLQQAAFPLTGGDMTVGFTDLVALPRRDARKA